MIKFYHHCSIPGLFSLLVECFSDNKFSNVPSFSKHFKVLKFHVRNQIPVWAFLHFTTHSRVRNSRQNVFFKKVPISEVIKAFLLEINVKYR